MSPVSSRTIMMSRPATTSGFSVDALGELRIQQRGPQVREQAERLADRRAAPAPAASRAAACRTAGRRRRPSAWRRRAARARACRAAADGRRRRSRRRRSAPSVGLDRRGLRRAARRAPRRASATISGPMPSPGRIAIFMRAATAPQSHGLRRRGACASNARISSACCSVRPMSSKPFSRQCLRKASTSNGNTSAAVGRRDGLRARGRSSA